jgi:hypothetical protein
MKSGHGTKNADIPPTVSTFYVLRYGFCFGNISLPLWIYVSILCEGIKGGFF